MPVHHHLPHIYKNIKFGTKVEEIQKNNPKRVMISLKCYRKRLLSPIPNTHTHTHTHTHTRENNGKDPGNTEQEKKNK